MKSRLLIAIAVICTMMQSCEIVSVNGDEEAVLMKKPYMFGSGGVDETPVSSGSQWAAPSTDAIKFKIVPVTHTEKFINMITADHTPVDFEAYLNLQVIKGKTPILYKNFGSEWYEHNIQAVFRTLVRNKVSEYEMFNLTSNRRVIDSIETFISNEISTFIKDKKMPVQVIQFSIGAVTPPAEVLDETRKTAAQNQAVLTQKARENVENTRKGADIAKANADNAYRIQMGMTMEEYLKMRSLEISKESVELAKENKNTSLIINMSPTGVISTQPVH